MTWRVPEDCRRSIVVDDGRTDPKVAAVNCQSLPDSLDHEADTAMAVLEKVAADCHKQKVAVRFLVAFEAAAYVNRDCPDRACNIAWALAAQEGRLETGNSLRHS